MLKNKEQTQEIPGGNFMSKLTPRIVRSTFNIFKQDLEDN